MNVLYVTPVLSWPAIGGPELRVENSIKTLSRIADLHVAYRSRVTDDTARSLKSNYELICAKFLGLPSSLPAARRPVIRVIRIIERGLKKLFGYSNEIDVMMDGRFLATYCERNNIDLVWFGYGNISYPLIHYFKRKMPGIKAVCDTDSVWSRFVLRGLPFENSDARKKQILKEGRKKEKEERALIEICDVVTAVSEVDAEYYRAVSARDDTVWLFSNALDFDRYDREAVPPDGLVSPCAVITGTYWPSSPMEKGTRWFLEEVFPIVRKQIPSAHIYIIGRGSKEVLTDVSGANITLLGELDDVIPYLKYCNISLVPLLFESGTRFKILEAGACETPVVSTSLGAEGIPVENGRNILIADTPQSFAEAIISMLRDKGKADRIAKELRILITENYGLDRLEKEAKQIFKYLGYDT